MVRAAAVARLLGGLSADEAARTPVVQARVPALCSALARLPQASFVASGTEAVWRDAHGFVARRRLALVALALCVD